MNRGHQNGVMRLCTTKSGRRIGLIRWLAHRRELTPTCGQVARATLIDTGTGSPRPKTDNGRRAEPYRNATVGNPTHYWLQRSLACTAVLCGRQGGRIFRHNAASRDAASSTSEPSLGCTQRRWARQTSRPGRKRVAAYSSSGDGVRHPGLGGRDRAGDAHGVPPTLPIYGDASRACRVASGALAVVPLRLRLCRRFPPRCDG